jgi:hypothetical protein
LTLNTCKLLILNGGQRQGSNRRRRSFQGRLARELSGLESADMVDAISLIVFSI